MNVARLPYVAPNASTTLPLMISAAVSSCPASLPTTGSNIASIVALGLAVMVVGVTLLFWRRRARAALIAVMLAMACAGLLGGRPTSALAAKDCSATATSVDDQTLQLPVIPTVTPTTASKASEPPPPVVPEAPLPVLLGLGALTILGVRIALSRGSNRSPQPDGSHASPDRV